MDHIASCTAKWLWFHACGGLGITSPKKNQPFPSIFIEKPNEPAESGPNGSHTDDNIVGKSLVTICVCVRALQKEQLKSIHQVIHTKNCLGVHLSAPLKQLTWWPKDMSADVFSQSAIQWSHSLYWEQKSQPHHFIADFIIGRKWSHGSLWLFFLKGVYRMLTDTPTDALTQTHMSKLYIFNAFSRARQAKPTQACCSGAAISSSLLALVIMHNSSPVVPSCRQVV